MKNTKWIFIVSGVAAVWLLSAAESGFIGQWGLWTSLGIVIADIIGASIAVDRNRLIEVNKNIAVKKKACEELCLELKRTNSEQAMRIRIMEDDIKEATERIERTSKELDKLRLKNVELGIELQKKAI